MKISNCCGAEMCEWEDIMICPNCQEHCEVEDNWIYEKEENN